MDYLDYNRGCNSARSGSLVLASSPEPGRRSSASTRSPELWPRQSASRETPASMVSNGSMSARASPSPVPSTPEPWKPWAKSKTVEEPTSRRRSQRGASDASIGRDPTRKASAANIEDWDSMACAEIVQPKAEKEWSGNDVEGDGDGEGEDGEASDSSEEDPSVVDKQKCKCGLFYPKAYNACPQCNAPRQKRRSSGGTAAPLRSSILSDEEKAQGSTMSGCGSPFKRECWSPEKHERCDSSREVEYARELYAEHQDIGYFFDDRGLLGAGAPKNWALAACQAEPCHQSWPSQNEIRCGFSRRAKMMNAKRTLQADTQRRKQEIASEKNLQLRALSQKSMQDALDVQQQRYLRLLFDPIEDLSSLPEEELLDETLCQSNARKQADDASDKAKKNWGLLRKHGCLASKSLGLLKKANRKSSIEDSQTGGRKSEAGNQSHGTTNILTNEQRTTLLNIFQRYVMRVSVGTGVDLMARSTWFRFLHHCGILGPTPAEAQQQADRERQGTTGSRQKSRTTLTNISFPQLANRNSTFVNPGREAPLDYGRQGGVSFSHASAVYSMYAEASVNPLDSPSLTFSNWVNAIQHILRGPTFYRTQTELLANLFGVILKRCEQFMGIQPVAERKPTSLGTARERKATAYSSNGSPDSDSPKASRKSSQALKKAGTQAGTDLTSILRSFVEDCRQKEEKPPLGVLGWHSDRAEEEMCEPEVLVLLHEYEGPLRSIFKHYANMRRKPLSAGTLAPSSSAKGRRDSLRIALAPGKILVAPDNIVAQDSDCDDGLSGSTSDLSEHMEARDAEDAAPSATQASRQITAGTADWPLIGSLLNRTSQLGIDENDASPSPSKGEAFCLSAQSGKMHTNIDGHGLRGEASGEKNRLSEKKGSTPAEMCMDTDTFLVMVHEFGFYPKVVQVHSVRQHLDISLKRRNATKLSYEAFIECLLRISFVYLSIYGNNVQQTAGSKAKCIWLLTFLRARYKHLGLGRRMSASERGEGLEAGRQTGHDWKKKSVDIDKMPLKSMLLWPALDAKVAPQTKKIGPQKERNSVMIQQLFG